MKTNKFLIGLMALALTLPMLGNDLGFAGNGKTNAVSGGGGAQSTNRSYYITSPNSARVGAPVVDYLNVTSDSASGKVSFYTVTNSLELSAASSGTTNKVYVASGGAAFVTDAIAVLYHADADVTERLIVLGSTATSVQFTNATLSAVAKGDKIYLMQRSGTLPVGNICLSTPPSKEFTVPVFRGEYRDPLLVEVDGAGTNLFGINAIQGRFVFQEMLGGVRR